MACAAANGGTLAAALDAFDLAFDTQYASARLAQLYGAAQERRDPEPQPNRIAGPSLRADEPELCGTKLPPLAGPPRGRLFELVQLEADVIVDTLPGRLELGARELDTLHAQLAAQVERVRALESGK